MVGVAVISADAGVGGVAGFAIVHRRKGEGSLQKSL
jgi:hypothetical protein